MNIIKYVKSKILAKSFDNKLSKVLKDVYSKESNKLVTHNNGDLVRGKHAWGEVNHDFVPGIYLRQMILYEGSTVISGVHKRDHAWFLLEGHITIVSGGINEDYEAPYVGFSNAGTQRVIRANEYSIFQNVFKNPLDNKDLDYVEKYNYALTKEEYNEYIKNK
tara:strand:+ start:498 stop:986 length:489 start_codon:yes stop_codon:yes gene_type:complete